MIVMDIWPIMIWPGRRSARKFTVAVRAVMIKCRNLVSKRPMVGKTGAITILARPVTRVRAINGNVITVHKGARKFMELK